MDNILLIGILFKVLLVFIAIVTFFVIKITVTKVFEVSKNEKPSVILVFPIVLLVILGWIWSFLLTSESSFRPKNRIEVKTESPKKLEKETIFNQPSNKVTWEEIQKQNRQENEKAIEKFETIKK